jgi:FdhD protein
MALNLAPGHEHPAGFAEPASGTSAVTRPVISVREGQAVELEDQIAVEEPLEIRLGGRRLSMTMRTPGEDEELVAGLLYAEQIITGPDDLDVMGRYHVTGEGVAGNVMNVLIKGDVSAIQERLRRNFVTSSSCGVCGKLAIEAVVSDLPPMQDHVTVPMSLFGTMAEALSGAQRTFERTGGLHAAAVFNTGGQLLILREDIGRHNAVDKVIGHMLLGRHLPLDRHILMVSGRVSFEIMQKAAVARIPVVAAVSAPSSLAIEFAEACAMTLVGFVRGQRLNVYAGARRLSRPGTRLHA